MDQERQDKTSGCPVCDGTRFWRSRTGRSICARCHPDALEALQVLANQVNGAAPIGSACAMQRSPVSHRAQWFCKQRYPY
jgi:hypothetical protein